MNINDNDSRCPVVAFYKSQAWLVNRRQDIRSKNLWFFLAVGRNTVGNRFSCSAFNSARSFSSLRGFGRLRGVSLSTSSFNSERFESFARNGIPRIHGGDQELFLPDIARRACHFVPEKSFWDFCQVQSITRNPSNGTLAFVLTLLAPRSFRTVPLIFDVSSSVFEGSTDVVRLRFRNDHREIVYATRKRRITPAGDFSSFVGNAKSIRRSSFSSGRISTDSS